jgi:hypothetical protein
MAEPKYIPRKAIVVDRYQELNNFTRAFATGHLRFLMVVGPAGTGKSDAMRRAMDGRAACPPQGHDVSLPKNRAMGKTTEASAGPATARLHGRRSSKLRRPPGRDGCPTCQTASGKSPNQ